MKRSIWFSGCDRHPDMTDIRKKYHEKDVCCGHICLEIFFLQRSSLVGTHTVWMDGQLHTAFRSVQTVSHMSRIADSLWKAPTCPRVGNLSYGIVLNIKTSQTQRKPHELVQWNCLYLAITGLKHHIMTQTCTINKQTHHKENRKSNKSDPLTA